jgi:beta-mannosidase
LSRTLQTRTLVLDTSDTSDAVGGSRETEWTVREALGDTSAWYVGAPLPEAGNNVSEASQAMVATPGWVPARVPGAVVDDLFRAGEVPDPRYGRNSRASEWVAERSWVYRRAVDLSEIADDEDAVLEFDGIDPGADVFWDGVHLGSITGLYRSGRFTIPDHLREAGRHKLALVVWPAPASEPQVGRTDRVGVHAPRLGYGWDFSPRLRHQGVWKSTRLRIGRAMITQVVARTSVAQAGSATEGVVDVTVAVGGRSPHPGLPLTARLTVLFDGQPVATATQPLPTDSLSATLTTAIPAPHLWWPTGFGEQPLYEVVVTVEHEGDPESPLDSAARHVAFRTATLVANPGAPNGALPYTASVNDVVVPLLGWNWAPADTLYGSIDEAKVEHLLTLAARSGARLIRVWGGGLIESEHFYDTCDRLGMLVWQEFSQSSSGLQSAPSTDAAFVELMRAEAVAIIPTRVHHPSLLLWGGGNELDDGGVPLDDERSPVLAALHEAVAELDPGRAWLPTSPTGPEFHNRLDRIQAAPDAQHDVHGPWEHQGLEAHYTLYNAGTSLAHTEFGVEGMTNLRSLEALIPEADRWPADRTNPVYRHLGEWWNNAGQVNELFGGRLSTLADLNRASQLLQATGLQYAIEADHRRAPRCSMILPWQLGESYPNAWCTSSVDFRGEPKPAYFAVARAFERRRATFRVDRAAWGGRTQASAEAWLWAEHAVAAGSTLAVRVKLLDGTVVAETAGPVGHVGDPRPAARLDLDLSGLGGATLFLWEAEWRAFDGSLLDLERMLASATSDLASLLDLPDAEVELTVGDGQITVRNTGTVGVPSLRIADARPVDARGWLIADGDPRALLPGEERVLALRWSHTSGPVAARLEGWNLPGGGIAL